MYGVEGAQHPRKTQRLCYGGNCKGGNEVLRRRRWHLVRWQEDGTSAVTWRKQGSHASVGEAIMREAEITDT